MSKFRADTIITFILFTIAFVGGSLGMGDILLKLFFFGKPELAGCIGLFLGHCSNLLHFFLVVSVWAYIYYVLRKFLAYLYPNIIYSDIEERKLDKRDYNFASEYRKTNKIRLLLLILVLVGVVALVYIFARYPS